MSVAREPAYIVGLRQADSGGKSFRLIPFGNVSVDVKPRYLIKGILPEVGIGIMYGDKKSYKSFIALDMMMHIVLGRNYRSRRVRQGPVIYLVLEGRDGFDKRIEAARKHFNLDGSDVPLFLIKDRVQLDDDYLVLIRDLKTKLEGPPPVAIVIDTLKRTLSGSENDDKDMGALLNAAQSISDEMKCFTMLVHHTGHGGAHPRGHSSLGAAVDVQIRVEKKANSRVSATIELAKDLPEGECWHSAMREISLMQDDDGDAITSMVVDPISSVADDGPEPKAEQPVAVAQGGHGLKDREMKALRALYEKPSASLGTVAKMIGLKGAGSVTSIFQKLVERKTGLVQKSKGYWVITRKGAALLDP